MGPVHGLDEAMADPAFAAASLTEETPLPGGTTADGVGPWNVGLGETPGRPAPQLGEHTTAILAELGIRN
jgi:crotonobetainyl-CoA:carnitine CoA-transferase CaiB-like acyl-CoA transferase